jgi:lipopolysaccharide export system protein LptA
MLAIGFVVYLACYLIYTRTSLGVMDGLPVLPEAFRIENQEVRNGEVIVPRREPPLQKKFIMAFGPGCEELKRPIRLEMHSKKSLLAVDQFELTEDGRRILLKPLSLALFGKDRNDGRFVEINTVRCNQAYLTLNQPVKSPTELNNRKIIAAELIGDVRIVNNRRTPERFDDLTLYINKGPVYYEEAKHKIWTSDSIYMKDLKNSPPTEVRGEGMEVTLETEASAPAPGKPKKGGTGGDNITGVKQIVLQSTVEMHLHVESDSPFPGNDPSRAPAKPNGDVDVDLGKKGSEKPPEVRLMGPELPPEKAHIIITTPGRFVYDMFKDYDLATFSVPNAGLAGAAPSFITVIRQNPRSDANQMINNDQLVCEHLIVRLKRREEKDPKNPQAPVRPASNDSVEQGMEIETVHATGSTADSVTITSDAEHLEAHGNLLDYDSRTQKTLLKGTPGMSATKEEPEGTDRSVIQAPQLEIEDHKPVKPADKGWQNAVAIGAGRIDVYDKKTDKKKMQATWKDKLTWTKDGPLDLLILNGQARFDDQTEEHRQSLRGETLKVWMNGRDRPTPQPAGRETQTSAGRPHHVEAITAVELNSKDLVVHDTAHLMIYIEDLPAGVTLPAKAAEAKFVGPPPRDEVVAPPASAPMGPTAPGVATGPATRVEPEPAPAPKPEEKKTDPPRPVDLTARSVEVTVIRLPAPDDPAKQAANAPGTRGSEQHLLKKLWAEGAVEVHQDPAKAEEKGIFIKGETLLMENQLEFKNEMKADTKADPNNYFLKVRGDQEILAQLLMDKIFITSTEINIDQATNKAWCNEAGAMRMESTSTLAGDTTTKPVPLTIYWDSTMLFDGCYADFRGGPKGGVQAEQQNAHLAGQALQVFFDKPISLKEGNKNGDPARVKNMVVDHNVIIEDYAYEKDNPKKLEKFTQLQGPSVAQERLEPDPDTPRPIERDAEGHPILGRDGKPIEKKQFKLGSDGKPLLDKDGNPIEEKPQDDNEIRARGPGSIKIVQKGGGDPMAPPDSASKPKPEAAKPKADGKDKPAEQQMKMTYVNFAKSMYANTRTNTAIFMENVRLLNMPWDVDHDDPKREINLDTMLEDLPEGAMYLKSDRLDVMNRAPKGSPTSQNELFARGRVLIQSKEYWGRAETVTFNEVKDQLILDGGEGDALLYKVTRVGEKPTEIRGKKITYIRKTGQWKIDNGKGIIGTN